MNAMQTPVSDSDGSDLLVRASFRVRHIVVSVAAFLLVAVVASGGVIAEFRGQQERVATTSEQFPLEISDLQAEYGISVTAILDGGSGSLRVLDSSGAEVYQHLWSTRRSQERARLPLSSPGNYRVEVALDDAQGAWRARVVQLPSRSSLRLMYVSAAISLALPCLFAVALRRQRATFGVVAAGIGMYLLGQAIWYAGAILLHVGAEAKLEDALPYRAFVWMESIALGAWQGIAAAAGVWLVARGMKLAGKTRRDAFSAGLAGGGLELFLIGIGTVLGLFITFGMGAKSDKALFNLAYSMAVTPGLALVDPAIQVCGVVCRVAATMLIVGGMRFRRYGQIALGVFVFGAVLTAASAARTIELLGPESRWLLLGVSAGVSAFAILVLRRSAVQWPEAGNGEESPMEVFLRQHGETGEDA